MAEKKKVEKSTREISPRAVKLTHKKSVPCSHALVEKKVKLHKNPRKASDNLASDSVSQDSDSSQRLVRYTYLTSWMVLNPFRILEDVICLLFNG